jgi:hypothetical protein
MLEQYWRQVVGRLHGPMTFRIYMQPAMAAVLAIRAGIRDARRGRVPYFWAVLVDRPHRRELVKEGWKEVGRVFVLATIIDWVYQVVEFHRLYFGEAALVAVVLAIVPYLLLRGPTSRIARRMHVKREEQKGGSNGEER